MGLDKKPSYLKFLIFDDNTLFKHPGKNFPCYRKVLCHAAINKFFQNNHNTIDKTQNFDKIFSDFLNNIKNALNSKLDIDQKNGMVRLYHFKDGQLLIDDSEGFYPLIIWTEKKEPFSSRAVALNTAINDLNDKRSIISKLFNDNIADLKNADKHWSKKFDQDLERIFSYEDIPENTNRNLSNR